MDVIAKGARELREKRELRIQLWGMPVFRKD